MASNRTIHGKARLRLSMEKKKNILKAATKYRSICHTHNRYLGDKWYDTEDEAYYNRDGHAAPNCQVTIQERVNPE